LEAWPRQIVWSLPEGDVRLSCTRALTAEEHAEVTELVAIFLRSLRRNLAGPEPAPNDVKAPELAELTAS
jgi:hypothetical protein